MMRSSVVDLLAFCLERGWVSCWNDYGNITMWGSEAGGDERAMVEGTMKVMSFEGSEKEFSVGALCHLFLCLVCMFVYVNVPRPL